jgi:inner membrane protein
MAFEDIVFWHWWIVSLGFFIFEMLVGSYFFLFIGAAAAVVGLLLLIFSGMSWPIQFVLWGVFSVVSVVAWRIYRKNNPVVSKEPTLNQRGQQYVGRNFTLEEPVVNGQGKIKVDDSTWKIEAAEDFESGTKVTVTEADGTVLRVEKAA